MASMFDPLGEWEPHTIVLSFQEAVWAVKGWDDANTLPKSIEQIWSATKWRRIGTNEDSMMNGNEGNAGRRARAAHLF